MVKRRICIFTGSRAEYGLLRPLILALKAESCFEVCLLVSGAHVSGKDGVFIDARVRISTADDSSVGVAKAMARGLVSFTGILEEWRPDLIIILGDRYEALAAAISAMLARVPIAHLHGGEATFGLIDEAIRHSITKMSLLHFTSTEVYRQKVVQLGESPHRVFYVGALGVDNAHQGKLISKKEFQNQIGFKLNKNNLLITFHPVTLEPNKSQLYVQNLLKALDGLKETNLIFTKSNADMEGGKLNQIIEKYVKQNRHKAILCASMGQQLYMTAMKYTDAVVGNSSSGIIEAPSFRIGTINIGNRQEGRIQAPSVINCRPTVAEIRKALRKLYSPSFQKVLHKIVNPYGQGDTASRIVRILKRQGFSSSLNKKFYQLRVR